jgi:NADPH-dependent ferric siderophore reductase
MAHRAFTSHPLVVRRVTVRRIEEVTPRMRRLVVGGDGLAASVVDGHEHRAFAAPGFDDHVKLVFAADGDIESALPRQLPSGIEWTPSENRVARDYTPRWVDTAAGEVALDFVLHGDGPAATWAMSAAEGDELCFVGPKSSLRLPDGIDWILLVADETGLPAVGRFLDERPIDAPAHIVCVIEDESARQELAVREGDTIAWVIAPGGDAAALEEAVRAVPLPDGEGYAWAAAESRALLPVRKYLQRERGLPKDRLNLTGYWHLEEEHVDERSAAVEPSPEVPSPLPWLVVRAAVQLGIVEALADGPLALDALAARVRVPSRAVAPLLPVLSAHGIVEGDASSLALGAAGEELLDEHEREEYVGLEADLVLALTELAPAIRSGRSAWQAAHDETLAASAAREAEVYDGLAEESEGLAYLLDGLLADPVWEGIGSCVVAGPGVPAVIGALEDAGRGELRVSVRAGGAATEVLRGAVEDPSRVDWDGAASDLAVLAQAIGHLTDEEASALLAETAALAPVVVVVERARPDALGPAAATGDVTAYAKTGSALRSPDDVTRLAEPAGWHRERDLELGWGVMATVLRRG